MNKKAFTIQRSYVIESLTSALRTLEEKLRGVSEQKAADAANEIHNLLAASNLKCTMELHEQEKLIGELLLNVRNVIYELKDFRESFSHDKELLEAFFLDIIFADETKLGSIVDEKTKNKSSTIEDLLNAEKVALLLPELDRSSAFTKLIDAYNVKGELEESLRVADLLSSKVKPNAYYIIFDACLKKGQYLDALRVTEMITFNAELKKKCLLKVIGQYLKDEMFKESEELARSFSDSRLSAGAFSKIVIAYNRKNRLAKGREVFQEMMKNIKHAHLASGQKFKYRHFELDTLIKSIAKDLVAMSRPTEGSESEKLFEAAKKYTRKISHPKVAKAVFL